MPHANYMRSHRLKSDLSMSDMIFLDNKLTGARLSRVERGRSIPNLRTLLLYQFLFDVDFTTLLQSHRVNVLHNLKERLPVLLDRLKSRPSSMRLQHRIAHIESVIVRLSTVEI